MSEIEISGSTKNLNVLMNALALPRSNKSSGKGDNMEFPYRKVIVKSNGMLLARQKNNSVYSQVVCRTDVETPFIKLKGEGDIMFDMAKTLKYLRELAVYETARIIHDTETHQTIFRGEKDSDFEVWYTFEPSNEIDDGRNETPVKCGCTDAATCTKCNGSGTVPSAALSFKNPINIVPPSGSPYVNVGVQFDIDSAIMRMIGDKTENLLDDMYPLQFNKDHLIVFAGDPKDISNDSFKKQIPMTYTVNNMVEKIVTLGSDFRNVFGSLDGKVQIQSEDVPDNEKSVYVLKNDIGISIGVKLQAKSKDV
jgi:hypothetical protein